MPTRARAPTARSVADYTGTEVVVCPSIAARNWQNDAYSPRTGLPPHLRGHRSRAADRP